MTSTTGVTPPLRRRFSERKSRQLIRERYEQFRKRIPEQVRRLQQDAGFRDLCVDYYARGYPDWVILGSVLSCMASWKLRRDGFDAHDPHKSERMRELTDGLTGASYPPWLFTREEMDRVMAAQNAAMLLTYGFEPPRCSFDAAVVERFLRARMRHFEFDLPHSPLFGTPPGDWPTP